MDEIERKRIVAETIDIFKEEMVLANEKIRTLKYENSYLKAALYRATNVPWQVFVPHADGMKLN